MKRIIYLCLALSLISCITITPLKANAAVKIDSGDRAVAFTIVTDIGPQVFATRHYYVLKEEVSHVGTMASGSIQFTEHHTASWCVGWSGAAFGDISVITPYTVSFYNNNGVLVGSASTVTDRDKIFSPDWIGYDSTTGTTSVSVNTTTASAKATFEVFCPDAVYGNSTYVGEVTYVIQ